MTLPTSGNTGTEHESASPSTKPLARALGQSESSRTSSTRPRWNCRRSAPCSGRRLPIWAQCRAWNKRYQKTETVEDKVQVAAEKLSEVKEALQDEVHERHVLEFRLAAVTERAGSVQEFRLS